MESQGFWLQVLDQYGLSVVVFAVFFVWLERKLFDDKKGLVTTTVRQYQESIAKRDEILTKSQEKSDEVQRDNSEMLRGIKSSMETLAKSVVKNEKIHEASNARFEELHKNSVFTMEKATESFEIASQEIRALREEREPLRRKAS